MKIFTRILILMLFTVWSHQTIAQIKYNELIDTAVLASAELKVIDKLNTKNLEFSPTIYNDGLVYVSSSPKRNRKMDLDIGETFFSLLYAPFDSLGNVEEVDNFSNVFKVKNHLGPCAFNKNEDIVFITRNKRTVVQVKNEEKDVFPLGIYIYKYENGYWISKGELPVNSNKYKVMHPTWDEKNKRLIFASDMPGGYGETDLYSIKMNKDGWTELKNLGPMVNSDKKEAFPFIYNSKYLLFASERTGGIGGFDIYFSIEDEDKFTSPINIGDRFNSEYDDFGLIFNEDATIGYFTSSRPGGKGKDDIYKISSEKSIFRIFNTYFTVNVKDEDNQKPVENARITFSKFAISPQESPKIAKIKGIEKEIIYTIDQSSLKESSPIFSDNSGEKFVKLAPGSYIVKVSKDGYSPYSGVLYTEKSNKLINIQLTPERRDTFEFSFLDSKSNRVLENVLVQIEGGDEDNKIIKKDGKYYFILTRGNRVSINATSKGYTGKNIDIEYGSTPSKFDILLDVEKNYVEYLPTAKGEVFILKDIFYKYNSDKLSKSAQKEFQKLAKHLKTYPELVIELSSYTDSRGRKEYNQKLSERRSKNAKAYLVEIGVDAKRIKVKGFGESKLRNHCYDGVKCSDKEHAINRRTEVKVVD